MFVSFVISVISWAFAVTSWVDFFNISAFWVFGGFNVMSTLLHGVWITSGFVRPVSSCDDSGAFEPVPWSSDLSSVTSHGLTFKEPTTPGGVSYRQWSVEFSVGFDAQSIVISFSGSMSPA